MTAIRSEDGRAGLTLIEVTIGAFLVLVLVISAGAIYLGTERSFNTGAAKLLAQREGTLLSTWISRRVRIGSDLMVYETPDRDVPADSGDGLAILDDQGRRIDRLEWSASLLTMVDSTGAPVTAMILRDVLFRIDPASPQTVAYRFKTDDTHGNLVDFEGAVSVRN